MWASLSTCIQGVSAPLKAGSNLPSPSNSRDAHKLHVELD